jgi:hypothetical protein
MKRRAFIQEAPSTELTFRETGSKRGHCFHIAQETATSKHPSREH